MKNSELFREIQKCMKVNKESFLTYEVRRSSFNIKSYLSKKSYSFSIETAARR